MFSLPVGTRQSFEAVLKTIRNFISKFWEKMSNERNIKWNVKKLFFCEFETLRTNCKGLSDKKVFQVCCKKKRKI